MTLKDLSIPPEDTTHCWRMYRAVFDASEDAVLLTRLDGNIFECNQAACTLYGYTHEEITTMRLVDLVPEQLAFTVPDIITEDFTTGGTFIWTTGKSRDGHVFPERLSTKIIQIRDNDCLLVCVRKLVIRKSSWLADTEDISHHLTERDVPVYTITWKSLQDDFIMIGCNMAAESFTSKELTDLIGKKASELFSNRPDILEDMKVSFKSRTVLKKTINYQIISTGGERRMETTYGYMPPNLLLVYLKDVTDRERALCALRQNEQRMRTQYLYMPIATITWKKEGNDFSLMDYNLAAEETTYGEISNYIGKSAGEIYADQPDILHDFRRCFDEQTFVKREIPYMMFTSSQKRFVAMTCTYIPPDLVMSHIEDITARKKAEKELRNSEKNLRILSSQLMNGEEKVRKRIAMELHDSIGQCLSAIKFNAENTLVRMMHSGTAEGLESLRAGIPLIQRAIEEVRKICMDLRPSILDDLGILATISWSCREFQEVYSDITVEKSICIEEEDVPDRLKIIMYRIMQEALNNAAKHSKADRVRVSLGKDNRGIVMMIHDNGTGFDLKKALVRNGPSGGMGLASMRERVQLSGGIFSIKTKKGKGTTVRAVWLKDKWPFLTLNQSVLNGERG